jgi:hypothetical protein
MQTNHRREEQLGNTPGKVQGTWSGRLVKGPSDIPSVRLVSSLGLSGIERNGTIRIILNIRAQGCWSVVIHDVNQSNDLIGEHNLAIRLTGLIGIGVQFIGQTVEPAAALWFENPMLDRDDSIPSLLPPRSRAGPSNNFRSRLDRPGYRLYVDQGYKVLRL